MNADVTRFSLRAQSTPQTDRVWFFGSADKRDLPEGTCIMIRRDDIYDDLEESYRRGILRGAVLVGGAVGIGLILGGILRWWI